MVESLKQGGVGGEKTSFTEQYFVIPSLSDMEARLKAVTLELEQLRRGWISGVKKMVDQGN